MLVLMETLFKFCWQMEQKPKGIQRERERETGEREREKREEKIEKRKERKVCV